MSQSETITAAATRFRLGATTGVAIHATFERDASPSGEPPPTATRTPPPTATLVSVAPSALSETYACDLLRNLRVKAGVAYDHPAAGQPRPHAPIRAGGQAYAYDANGNLMSGGGRTYAWNGWNQLASVSQSGVSETYANDAEGERVTLAGYEARGARRAVSSAERGVRGPAPLRRADAPYAG